MDGPSLEKDRTAPNSKANNGYATLLLSTLENRNHKLDSDERSKSPYQGYLKLTQRELGVVLLTGILCGLIFASLPEQFLLATCSLLKLSSRFLLPGLTTASLFYWCSITVQKYLDSRASLWIMPVFVATELLVQILRYFYSDSNNGVATYICLVAVVVLSVLYALPEMRGEGTYIFAVCLLITNIFNRTLAGESQGLLRYILINAAAFAGEFFTRVLILPMAEKPSEIEAKMNIANAKSSFKNRRSSSTSSTNSRRRVSLPVLNFQAMKSTIDATTLGEAHGMLSDLLADSNLPGNVASTLKVISTMIAQPTFSSFARGVNSMSPLVESRYIPDEKICEQPDMMDDGWGRSRPHHNRRMSNLFTTTTSATGMPTLERDGCVAIPNNIASHSIPCGSPRSGSPTGFIPPSKLLRQAKSLPHNMPHLQDTVRPNEVRSSSPVLRKIPSENGAFTAVHEDKPTLEETCKSCGCSETHVAASADEPASFEPGKECAFPAISFYGKRKPTVEEVLEKAKNVVNNDEVEKLYDKIDNWNFPIFDVWANGNVLRGVAYKIFKKSGFFEKFRIRDQVFLNYFTALESGYNDIPYHNSVHAADVLHGVYYFTSQRIAGFCPFDTGDRNSDSDSASGDQPEEAIEHVDQYDKLTSCIPDLERFALYSAAAMHDYDHPGRTNAFVVATIAPQALLYNDRSVLENHHVAQAFSLMLSSPEYNYVESLTSADFKRFRFLVIEAVLATDLKRHFDVLQEFTAKVDSGAGIDWSLEADRLLASQVCIKMADISGPSKQKDIHQRWTERIVEEFYEQGEDELVKGLPVSPYMDRKVPLVAQLQETFIKHLVAPLFRSYRSAGLLPGVWVTSSEYDDQEDSDGDSSTKDEESTEHSDSGVGHHRSCSGKKRIGKKKKRRKRRRASKEIHCEIMENIETNYQMWSRRIKEQEMANAKAKDAPREDGGIVEEDGGEDNKETEN